MRVSEWVVTVSANGRAALPGAHILVKELVAPDALHWARL